MSIVWIEGFDLYNGNNANTLGLRSRWSSSYITDKQLVLGRFGGQALRVPNVGGIENCYSNLPSSYSTYTIGVAFQCSQLNNAIIEMSNSGSIQHTLFLNSSGKLEIKRGTRTGTVVGTSSSIFAVDTWYYAEMTIVVSATVGVANLDVDGVNEINGTGLNTGTTSINRIECCEDAPTCDFDDMYFADDTTKRGPLRIEVLHPSSDYSITGYTPDTGSTNWDRVDDTASDGDTTYIQASSASDIALFTMDDLSATPDGAIAAVELVNVSRRTDAGSRSISNTYDSGGTTGDGSITALGSTYAWYRDLYLTDPNTSSAWTAAGVNALKAGVKVKV